MPPTSKTILAYAPWKRKIMMFMRKYILMMFSRKKKIGRKVWVTKQEDVTFFISFFLCRVCCRKDPSSHSLEVLCPLVKISMSSRFASSAKSTWENNYVE
jgi:hypothetical protein